MGTGSKKKFASAVDISRIEAILVLARMGNPKGEVQMSQNENENEESESRKKRESKPRDIVFDCFAAIDGDIVVEKIRITTEPGEAAEGELVVKPSSEHTSMVSTQAGDREKITASDDVLRAIAVEAFEAKHGTEPEDNHVRGPYYERKGLVVQQAKPGRKRRAALQIDLDKVRFGRSKARAEFNDWKVTAQYISNPEECIDNYDSANGKAVMIMFKEPITPSTDKKKIIPNSRWLWEKDLKNVEKQESA